MFRSFQIIIKEFRRSLLKLRHIQDLVRFCKKGVVAAYHVVYCYAAYDAHLANYTLYNRFLHNMICCHNALFTKTNQIVNM